MVFIMSSVSCFFYTRVGFNLEIFQERQTICLHDLFLLRFCVFLQECASLSEKSRLLQRLPKEVKQTGRLGSLMISGVLLKAS